MGVAPMIAWTSAVVTNVHGFAPPDDDDFAGAFVGAEELPPSMELDVDVVEVSDPDDFLALDPHDVASNATTTQPAATNVRE